MKKNIPQLLDLIEKRICSSTDCEHEHKMSEKEKEAMLEEMDIFCVFILTKARMALERAYEIKKDKCCMPEELFKRLEESLTEIEEFYNVKAQS